MDTGFVYRWIDNSNGKYYIGSRKGSVDSKYIGSGKHFKWAYKNRPESFAREILYIGEDYRELEAFILDVLDAKNDNNSYNLVNGMYGVTEDGFKRISESRKRSSSWSKGLNFTDEHRAKISKAHLGKKKSKQHRLNLSKAMTGKTGELARNKKPVYCGVLDREFPTMTECAKALGIHKRIVQSMINGRTKDRFKLKLL
jgi:hypothetical protein